MPEQPTPAEEPERIGPYRILQKLGVGGMGVVYEAEQTRPVRRRVALKIIKLGMDTEQVVARFEAERQALAVMDHPGIARVFDAGVTETGRPYFVMELVRGLSLPEYCDRYKLSLEDRLRLFVRICNAVQHAHQKGVIHRDLKPSNVLVIEQDGRPVPKVIDFGIAKAIGHELTDRTLVTQLGHFIGTPRYVSPEQAEMSGLDVDTRTDIYSLGVMLYELLSGAAPFDFLGIAWAAVSSVIREKDPPTPSSRFNTLPENTRESVARQRKTDPGALRRELKGDLDAVVMKCLEKDRSRRYETANALALDLERHIGHEPVLAQPPSATYRLRKFVRRHRAGTAFAAVLVVLLTAFAVSMSVQAARLARERDRSAREAAKAEAVRAFMEGVLVAPDPVNALGPEASILEAVNRTVSLAEDGFSDDPEVDAAIRNTIGRVYLRLGQYDAAQPLLEAALQFRSASQGEGSLDLAETLGLLADLSRVRSEPDSAAALYERSLGLFRGLAPADDPRLADLVVRRADLLTAMGRYDEAEAGLIEGIELHRDRGADNPHIADAMSRLSILYRTIGDLERAEQSARAALEHRQRLLRADHPLIGESLNNLAVILDDKGEKEQALEYYRQAVANAEAVFGEESEYVAAMLNNLALVVAATGDAAGAESLYRRALDIDRKLLGDDGLGVAIDRLNLGRHLCLNARADEGTRLVNAAVRTFERVFEPGQLELALARSGLGVCLGEAGRFEEAESMLLAALRDIEQAVGAQHPRASDVGNRLADLYEAWGRPQQALGYRR